MSTIVNTIITNIKTIINSEIGSEFTALPHEINIEMNNLKTSKKGYAVLPEDLSSDSGVTRALTIKQGFEITLTDNYINKGNNDTAQKTATNYLYQKIFEIYNKLYLSKIGLGTTVMNVNDLTISKPEYLENDNVVILRSSLQVIYRQAIV